MQHVFAQQPFAGTETRTDIQQRNPQVQMVWWMPSLAIGLHCSSCCCPACKHPAACLATAFLNLSLSIDTTCLSQNSSSQLRTCPGDRSAARSKNTRLLVLTEWGNLSLWSVQALVSSGAATRVQTDPGLSLGGHVCLLLLATSLTFGKGHVAKMQPSASVELPAEDNACGFRLHQRALALALLPGDQNQFLVGTNGSQVLRGSLYGEVPVPKVSLKYTPMAWEVSILVEPNLD